MNKLIVALAALMITNASASEAIVTVRPYICAKYQGCWSDQCQISPEVSDNSIISCKLVDGVGAYCNPGPYRGNFRSSATTLEIEAYRGQATFQLISTSNVTILRIYEKDTYLGIQCLANVSINVPAPAPQKPEPKAPPLLQKPNKDNAPTKPKATELEKVSV